jgi:hypothetical protein
MCNKIYNYIFESLDKCIKEQYILNKLEKSNQDSIILGAGLSENNSKIMKFKNILLIRGPITYKYLIEKYPCQYIPELYGDIRILLPLINFLPEEKIITKKYLFICNKKDFSLYTNIIIENCDIITINKYENINNFLNILNNYDYILTNSLNGLIISLAYGKNTMVLKNKLKINIACKLNDFLCSIGETNININRIFNFFVNFNKIIISDSLFIKPNDKLIKILQYNVINKMKLKLNVCNNVNHLIILETFLLKDNEFNKDIIDNRINLFTEYTLSSIYNQTYNNYKYILYIQKNNDYLIEKIKDIIFNDNTLIYYYDVDDYKDYPDINLKNYNNEGFIRGNWKIRNELSEKSCKIFLQTNKNIIKLCIDDDDYIESTHFDDLNFYGNIYAKDNESIILKFKNFKIHYTELDNNDHIENIIGIRYVHGNKMLIINREKSIYYSGYNISEVEDNIIIEKPNSTFHYMRHKSCNHISTHNKRWLVKYDINY